MIEFPDMVAPVEGFEMTAMSSLLTYSGQNQTGIFTVRNPDTDAAFHGRAPYAVDFYAQSFSLAWTYFRHPDGRQGLGVQFGNVNKLLAEEQRGEWATAFTYIPAELVESRLIDNEIRHQLERTVTDKWAEAWWRQAGE